jgi:perosamine synthetase
MLNKLAYFGGTKSIKTASPHWEWPPKSKGKIRAINNYYKTESMDGVYFPRAVKDFEKNFCIYQKSKYSLSFNSGTSSIHAAFFAVGVKEKDEVLVPALTFHSTATPLVQLGAIPVICDAQLDTGNIDPKSIEKKITSKTKALIITHLCGHPCDMDEILKICKKNKIKLIEDCSHAHGATYKGKKVGSFGDISCFSLGNQKMLAAGEGGILVTNNREYFEKSLLISDFSQRLSDQITIPKFKKFIETGVGFKHRIHPLSATIANHELSRINYYITKRNKVLNKFSNSISNIPGISGPITKKGNFRGAFFGYRPFFKSEELGNITINNFIKILNAEGMEIRRASHNPLHLLNLFSHIKETYKFLDKDVKNNYIKKNDLPNAIKFYNSTLSIPTFTFEKKKLIENYISCFQKVCNILSKSSARDINKKLSVK